MGGISHKFAEPVENIWKIFKTEVDKKKKLLTDKVVSFVDDIMIKNVRLAIGHGRKKEIVTKSAPITAQEYLAETEDLTTYYSLEVILTGDEFYLGNTFKLKLYHKVVKLDKKTKLPARNKFCDCKNSIQ